MEAKGFRVNMSKTTFMVSRLKLDVLRDAGKYPCGVCRSGVGVAFISCTQCKHWMHKKCSGLKKLTPDPTYVCPRCSRVPGVRPIDGMPLKKIQIDDCELAVVDRLCYLGDMLCAAGSYMAVAIACCKCAWGKFGEPLPLLTAQSISFTSNGGMFNSWVRSAMLHTSEMWAASSDTLPST